MSANVTLSTVIWIKKSPKMKTQGVYPSFGQYMFHMLGQFMGEPTNSTWRNPPTMQAKP
jgi:hypothetical protein